MLPGRRDKDVPFCTLFLVVGALVSHITVFTGNLATANTLRNLGTSTEGWSDVGLSLSRSLSTEVEEILGNISSSLTGAIEVVGQIQSGLDLAIGVTGHVVDGAAEYYRKRLIPVPTAPPAAALLGAEQEEPPQLLQAGRREALAAVLARTEARVGRLLAAASAPGALPFGVPVNRTQVARLAAEAGRRVSSWDPDEVSSQEFRVRLKQMLKDLVSKLLSPILALVHRFLELITPALNHIGRWLESFSERLQSVISQFSTTIDRVQKLFDQIMSTLSRPKGDGWQIRQDTYTLFDVDNVGGVNAEDLKNVSRIFSIQALRGAKAEALFKKYDANGNGRIGKKEFIQLVNDPSIPEVMAVVLRIYARRLATASGHLAGARRRAEVAKAVAQYISLTVSVSDDEVDLVAERVTNGSVPLQFTAALLRQLVLSRDDPDNLAVVDVGASLMRLMMKRRPPTAVQALNLVLNSSWWEAEGFDTSDLPDVAAATTGWAAAAFEDQKVPQQLGLELMDAHRFAAQGPNITGVERWDLVAAARRLAVQRVSRASKAATSASSQAQSQIYASTAALAIRDRLLGGSSASSASLDPELWRTVRQGVMAVPATLEFANFLAWNASAAASSYQQECFDYSSMSSSAIDTVATQIMAVFSKVQAFVNVMAELSQPVAIERLKTEVRAFLARAADDLANAVADHIDSLLTELLSKPLPGIAGEMDDRGRVVVRSPGDTAGPVQSRLSGVWATLIPQMASIQQMLPSAVANLQFAQQEVSAVSEALKTTFFVFKESGPPVFNNTSRIWKSVWTAYFAFFLLMTVCILYYGFWAHGWFHGPHVRTEDIVDYIAPQTLRENCLVCCSAMSSCLKAGYDSDLCFWSAVIIMQSIVLLAFILAMLVCMIAGVQGYLYTGCAQIYVLGDSAICSGTLGTVREWMETFASEFGVPLSDVCEHKKLLTCELIGNKLKAAAVTTSIGSVFAASFSFQMIVESALLHEQTRWKRLFDDSLKKV